MTNQTTNDQTLAQAVSEMLSVDEQPESNPVSPTVKPLDTASPPTASYDTTQPVISNADNSNGGVDISGKKIIQPIGNTTPQKSLQELVAQEEAQDMINNQINTAQANTKPFDPSDPNNVAL